MSKVLNKVIVWSIDDFNTLGLMRELGADDLDMLFLINGKAGFATKSRYCKKYVETDSIEDGYKYLLESFTEEALKPIVIVSSDEIITFIDQHRDELLKYFILPGTTVSGNTEKYTDKNSMTALAEELGFLCPRSVFLKKDSDISGIEYPCLIKPAHQKSGHYNEFKFRICKNARALRRTLKLVRNDSEFILQQYIPKTHDLMIYGARMWDGRTVVPGAFVRDRWADSGSSSHGYFSIDIPESAYINGIRAFLEHIDYYGPFSFEYGLLDGKAYFFEVNLRNDGTSHYFYQAGANIPLAYVYSAAGLDYSHIPTAVKHEGFFIDEIFDVENVILGRINRKTWKKDMAEATVFKYYDKEDTAPYEAVKKSRGRQIARDILLRKFRLYIVFILDRLKIGK